MFGFYEYILFKLASHHAPIIALTATLEYVKLLSRFFRLKRHVLFTTVVRID